MVISLEVLYKGIPCSESRLTPCGGTGLTGIKVSEVTVLHCNRGKELRNSDISHYKGRTQVKLYVLLLSVVHI